MLKYNNIGAVALTYDDIQLVPKYSTVTSRKTVSLQTMFTKRYGILRPLVAAPMDTVCEWQMAIEMMKHGGVGVIHRFMSIEDQVNQVKKVAEYRGQSTGTNETMYEDWGVMYDDWHTEIKDIPVCAAVGANGDFLERSSALISAGANVILIDVAHGHHENVKKAIIKIKALNPKVDVIAGNIATYEAANDLIEWGADALRVGVGGGSLCTTRVKTGFGVPNVTCLAEICSVSTIPVIADGGIRSSGDMAKALALGASSIMIGSMIAGTDEAPGEIIPTDSGVYKRYRGAASLETKMVHGQEARNVEGESTLIPYKGQVKYVIEDCLDGIKSALSYAGASRLEQFHPKIIQVTSAGQLEAKPHLIK
jgi:IMP dehydrogenase